MKRQISSANHGQSAAITTLAAILVFALSAVPAWGQATATVNGTVTDPGGAVVIAATVALHNRDTNLDRTGQTNGAGAYVMADVQPGNYDLKGTKSGFSPAIKHARQSGL